MNASSEREGDKWMTGKPRTKIIPQVKGYSKVNKLSTHFKEPVFLDFYRTIVAKAFSWIFNKQLLDEAGCCRRERLGHQRLTALDASTAVADTDPLTFHVKATNDR